MFFFKLIILFLNKKLEILHTNLVALRNSSDCK